jgi:hypothetical protein
LQGRRHPQAPRAACAAASPADLDAGAGAQLGADEGRVVQPAAVGRRHGGDGQPALARGRACRQQQAPRARAHAGRPGLQASAGHVYCARSPATKRSQAQRANAQWRAQPLLGQQVRQRCSPPSDHAPHATWLIAPPLVLAMVWLVHRLCEAGTMCTPAGIDDKKPVQCILWPSPPRHTYRVPFSLPAYVLRWRTSGSLLCLPRD